MELSAELPAIVVVLLGVDVAVGVRVGVTGFCARLGSGCAVRSRMYPHGLVVFHVPSTDPFFLSWVPSPPPVIVLGPPPNHFVSRPVLYASLSSQEYHSTLEAFYRHRGATGMPSSGGSGGGGAGADTQEDRLVGSPGDPTAAPTTNVSSSNFVAVGNAALAASASGASSSGSATGGSKELSPMPGAGSPLTRGLSSDNISKHGSGGGSNNNPPALSAGDAGEDATARVSAPIGGSSSGARGSTSGGSGGGATSAAGGKAVEETWWVMHEVTPMGTPSASVQSALSAEGAGGGGGSTGGAKGAASAKPGVGAGGARGEEPLGSKPHRKKLADGDDPDAIARGRGSNDTHGVGAGAGAAAGIGDGSSDDSGTGASPPQAAAGAANHGKGLGKRRLYESSDISKLEAQMRSPAKVRRGDMILHLYFPLAQPLSRKPANATSRD